MKEFFQKYNERDGDPYDAIELIEQKLYKVKQKVANADPSHIHDLSAISSMIDDYVATIKDEDLKPMQRGAEYQDYQPHHQGHGVQNHGGHYPLIYPMYPFYDERQRNDGSNYDRQRTERPRNEYRRNSSIGYGTRDFGRDYPNDYPPYYRGEGDQSGGQSGGSGEGFPNRRR